MQLTSLPGALVLEDGSAFAGRLWPYEPVREHSPLAAGEVVFTTAMTGYQEVCTDPSYRGQLVVMTWPLQGNYGVRPGSDEGPGASVSAFIAHHLEPAVELAAGEPLGVWLMRQRVPVLEGVDTRALTRRIRHHGVQRGALVRADLPGWEARGLSLASKASWTSDLDLVPAASTVRPYLVPPAGGVPARARVALMDYGAKRGLVDSLSSRGCEVIVLPWDSRAEEVVAWKPDGIVLSNGPGDPASLGSLLPCVRDLVHSGLPVFGVCLGHQLIALALGARTARLPYGHRGANQPVQAVLQGRPAGRVWMTSQNHGFAVLGDSLASSGLEMTERNVHDGSVEGLRHESLPVRSVQYHPEARPGPRDAEGAWDAFVEAVAAGAWPAGPDLSAATAEVEAPSDVGSGGVLVLGSGPIVIGQAAEFDYAGSQACLALRDLGVRTILVNNNPATAMVQPGVADVTARVPLTVESVTEVIARERPWALLPTLGGQTGLNLALALEEAGVLEQYGVRVLGTPLQAIRQAEDRGDFRALMDAIGEPVPDSRIATTVGEAVAAGRDLGLPVVVRPAYTLGGLGGGIARTPQALESIAAAGLAASAGRQVLIEQSLEGWKEIEFELVRDRAGTTLAVCSMENVDPLGVHTGDSIVVAPAQTLTDRELQRLRSAGLRIVQALGIEGGCNVQFALHPSGERYAVIEVNPRVSRSSALASKATGYPIARISAALALGRTLDSLPNPMARGTSAAFEPAIDYCVVKVPRWPFDKFPHADRRLGTQMKATGEVMAIGLTLEEAFGKAMRALDSDGEADLVADPLLIDLPNDRRLEALVAALRAGAGVGALAERTAISPLFLRALDRLARAERTFSSAAWSGLDAGAWHRAKQAGLSDRRLEALAGLPAGGARQERLRLGVRPVWKTVDTCAAEFPASTPYLYCTYGYDDELPERAPRADRERPPVLVVGSGPIRIGQGVEFDACGVGAVDALRCMGNPAVVLNSNPETVSTDADRSDLLCFEPTDLEAALDVAEAVGEACGGRGPLGTLVQFGGQTALNLAAGLEAAGITILGTSAAAIERLENRGHFASLLRSLGLAQPPGRAVRSVAEAVAAAAAVGYPVLVRPSFVLGGMAMEIAADEQTLRGYLGVALPLLVRGPLLIDRYISGVEFEVEVVCDGIEAHSCGVLEHVEPAGVHSGDSLVVHPGLAADPGLRRRAVLAAQRIAVAAGIVGHLNVQFVVPARPAAAGGKRSSSQRGRLYVLEANPRASRTVPFLSLATGTALVELATRCALGQPLRSMDLAPQHPAPAWSVKAPVFSHVRLAGIDPLLGPQMSSTGEAAGFGETLAQAMGDAITGAGLPTRPGYALVALADSDKDAGVDLCRQLAARGWRLLATPGTAEALRRAGILVEVLAKDDDQAVLEALRRHTVTLVVNTPRSGSRSDHPGSGGRLRRMAASAGVPVVTSLPTLEAMIGA